MIGTLATIGTAAASGAASAISQNNTNHKNLKIAEKQNEYNRKMYEQQLKDARDWYNEYESPLALRRQWQQAGFSPMAAIDGGSTSSGMQSVGSAEAASYDYQSPMSGVGGNMMQGLAAVSNQLNDQVNRENLLADIEYKKQQTRSLSIENDYNEHYLKRDRTGAFLRGLNGWDSGAASSFENYISRGPIEHLGNLYDSFKSHLNSAQLRYQNAAASNQKSQSEFTDLKKATERIEQQYLPLLHKASIGLSNAQKDRLLQLTPLEVEGKYDENYWNRILNPKKSDLLSRQIGSYELFDGKNMGSMLLNLIRILAK